MNKRTRSWLLAISSILTLTVGGLAAAVLHPGWFYHYKTSIGPHTVYSAEPLQPYFRQRVNRALSLTTQSLLRDSTFSMDICLGGSTYPSMMQRLFGNAFAWGFYNKVVINGSINSAANRHESGWNLEQLLAHEMAHCLQFNRYGLVRSNPVAGYPFWKWEGYPEYVARREPHQLDLRANIERLLAQADDDRWMVYADSSRTSRGYYMHWLLVQYAIDVRRLSYDQLLQDRKVVNVWKQEMMDWYYGTE